MEGGEGGRLPEGLRRGNTLPNCPLKDVESRGNCRMSNCPRMFERGCESRLASYEYSTYETICEREVELYIYRDGLKGEP